MEHYIHVGSYSFDLLKKKLSLTLYFDVDEGSAVYPNIPGHEAWYKDLEFDSVSIDTEKTFICSSEPSSLATTLSPKDIGECNNNPEVYYRVINDSIIESHRKEWHLTIDLATIESGVLSALSNFKDTLLFFYVTVKGDYNGTGWFTKQPKTVMFALYDYKSLYNRVFNTLQHSNKGCSDPCKCFDCNAATHILLLNGLESSLELERWRDGVEFWNLIHSKPTFGEKDCNCK